MARPGSSDGLRWQLAEEDEAGALFPDERRATRHVGTGEYRGLEFLHVNAKRIINTVPGSGFGFRYTINPYRGCSHACSYCAIGSTPILMSDGRAKPLAEVRPGDIVVGTEVAGCYRRYVPSQVLDHWSVIRRAWETTLSNGVQLVTSEDHRFLTDRGWKFVAGRQQNGECRSHLMPSSRLLGFELSPNETIEATAIEATAIECAPAPVVISIRDLGIDMTMYDITTATGDYVTNGVISHNCFARPTHDYLGLNIGEDFETKIVVKINAVERLRAELASPKWSGELIALGTNTDPYQAAEGKYHLTKGIIGVLAEARNPFSILTKSTLVLRDLPDLIAAAKRTSVRLDFSIGTLDRDVWRSTEPGTPPPERRMDAVRRLNEAGIPCGVLVAPILPGLSDGEGQIREVIEACVAAGAKSVTAVPLHLRGPMKEHYFSWLQRTHPALLARHERLFAQGAYQPRAEHDRVTRFVSELVPASRSESPMVGRGERLESEPEPPPRPPEVGIPVQLRLGT